MLLCGRIVLVARFLSVSYAQSLAHKDCVLEGHTFEWTVSVPTFDVV